MVFDRIVNRKIAFICKNMLLIVVLFGFYFEQCHSESPQLICEKTAKAIATFICECNKCNNFNTIYQEFLNHVVGGSCDNVLRIKDVNQYYSECLLWLKSAKCTEIITHKLPKKCLGQLIVLK